ncbi:unnamed protein product [Urochloa humidicola]
MAVVMSAEPPSPPPPDPVANTAVVEAAAPFSFPSLKTWGSHRSLRCAHVNRRGDAIVTGTARRSVVEKLDVAGKKAPRHSNKVEAGSRDATDADHVAAAAATEKAPGPAAAGCALPPWKLRTRRRPRAAAANREGD